MNINNYSSCEYIEVQAQLTSLLGLHGTSPGISVTSIAAFAANINPDTAYSQLCKDLERVGVTEDVIYQKEDKILQILKSQSMVSSNEIDDSNIEDRDQVDEVLETAYKQFCEDLNQVGVTKDSMPPKDNVLELLRSRGMVASSQISGSSNIEEEGQLQDPC